MDGSETLMLTIHTNLHLGIKGARCMNCQDWSGSDVQGRVETIEQSLFFPPRAEQGLAILLDRCIAHNIQNVLWLFLIPELVLSCVVIIFVSSNNKVYLCARIVVCTPPLYRVMQVSTPIFLNQQHSLVFAKCRIRKGSQHRCWQQKAASWRGCGWSWPVEASRGQAKSGSI